MNPFWLSTALSFGILFGAFAMVRGRPAREETLLAWINRTLVVLLPAVVVLHGFEHLGLMDTVGGWGWLAGVEPIVFPIYTALLVAHVIVNRRYFCRPP